MFREPCTCASTEERMRSALEGVDIDPLRCDLHFAEQRAQRDRDQAIEQERQKASDEADQLREALAAEGHPGAVAELQRRHEATLDPLEVSLARAVARPHLQAVPGGMALNATTDQIARRLGMRNADTPDQPLPPLDAA